MEKEREDEEKREVENSLKMLQEVSKYQLGRDDNQNEVLDHV